MRRALPLFATVAVAFVLVACSPASNSSESASSKPAGEEAEVSATPEDSATSEGAEESEVEGGGSGDVEMLAAPDGGPEGVDEFPIPAGATATTMELDAVQWTFFLEGMSFDDAKAFYNETLPAMGYTVQEGVTWVGEEVEMGFKGENLGVVMDAGMLGTMVGVSNSPDYWE